MTILAAHQPAFLPWPGYLDRIRQADVFVILTGVQFEKGSFTNRNRIKTPMGEQWLTVPLRDRRLKTAINQAKINNEFPWLRKHSKAIAHAYGKAPRFEENREKLAGAYKTRPDGRLYEFFTPFCVEHIRFWLKEYAIDTQLAVNEGPIFRTEQIIGACEDLGADTYLSGPLGRDYLNEDAFRETGIELRFHDYQMKPYPQLHGDFIPNLSVLDAWMMQEDLP